MKFCILFIFIMPFVTCLQKGIDIRHSQTRQFMLIDTGKNATQFAIQVNDTDFPIYYIGPVKDTICIGMRYRCGRTNMFRFPLKFQASRNYSYQTLRIEVDTTSMVNYSDEYLMQNGDVNFDSTKTYYSYLFTIKNISDSSIYMGRTFSVWNIHLELKNKSGQWVKIGNKLCELSTCRTGEPSIYLTPGQIMISKVRCYKGPYSTEARLAFGTADNQVYSNVFKQAVEEKLLN